MSQLLLNIVLDYYLESWGKIKNAKKQNYQIDIYTILTSTVQNTHFLQVYRKSHQDRQCTICPPPQKKKKKKQPQQIQNSEIISCTLYLKI